MNTTTAKPAAPPEAIPAARPDPAKAASTLRAAGTATLADWMAVLDAMEGAIDAHNGKNAKRRAGARTMRAVGFIASIVAAIVAGVLSGNPFVGIGVLTVGTIATFVAIKVPPADRIGSERTEFLRALLAELAKIAPQARVALAAQLDARRAIDATPLASGTGDAASSRSREDAWLRGELQGLPGLYLGWSVTEWHTLKRLRRKSTRGRVKNKAKLAIARRYTVRLDADRRLFDSEPTRSGGTRLPGGLIEVRETPRVWSLRARQDFDAKLQLQDPDDICASLDAVREGAGHKGQDGADYFGRLASTLVYLMKLCELRLAPRQPKKAAA